MDAQESADLLIDMSGWYMETALLEWAVEVGLPNLMANEPMTASEISASLSIATDRLAPVLDALVGMQVLDTQSCGYAMRDDIHDLLSPGTDAYLGDHVRHHARYWRLWSGLGSMLRHVVAPEPWMQDRSIHEDRPSHELLLRSSASESTRNERMRLLDIVLSGERGLLVDLGGGHGCLGLLAAEIRAFRIETWDVTNSEPTWLSFADRLQPTARQRVAFRSCDLLDADSWARCRPDVTDCILSHVLANYDEATVTALLRNVFSTFPESNIAVVTPWRPFGDARDPIESLLFDVLIQSATAGGRAQTNAEIRSSIEAAGGDIRKLTELDGSAVWLCRSR